MKIIAIEMGCAECGDKPLGTATLYDSVEEAKADRSAQVIWKEHPQGGEYFQTGSGGIWILPAEIQPLPEDFDWGYG